MPSVGFEPAIPAMKRTYNLDRMVSGTGSVGRLNYFDASIQTICEVHHMRISFHFIVEVKSLCRSVLYVLRAATRINVSLF
jgi:hypothetical protein